MKLRDYQQKAIDELYQWFMNNPTGNPCLELPTGAGKSIIVAALCRDAIKQWPSTRILMLTHQKELIEQNSEKLRLLWPNAPLGIYSASLKQKDVDRITFAGIQTVAKRADELGHKDLVIIDECHLINNKAEGQYRALLSDLKEINPNIRVIGLTATPYRLGQGKLTDGEDTLFDDIVNPVTVIELIEKGYLATLKSKMTETHFDLDGVKKRGGEYIESQLAVAVDKRETTQAIVKETLKFAQDRKSWLFFCAGVDHAEHMKDELIANGINTEIVHGKTKPKERARILKDFKAGKIRALTNANVLTTGFDAPNIDLVVMARPTLSTSLYVQMAGRGLRLKDHTDNCLVLDFAGNVSQHGPITNIRPPKAKGEKAGEAPAKPCPECHEILHLSAKNCPECGYEFPLEAKPKEIKLYQDDIMGREGVPMPCTEWRWFKHVSRKNGSEMLRVLYYNGLANKVDEYITLRHPRQVGQMAYMKVQKMLDQIGAKVDLNGDLHTVAQELNQLPAPSIIEYQRNGKYFNILKRVWSDDRKAIN